MALTDIVKAYDVRGLVDGQLTEEVVRALGAAFADEVGTAAPIVIGHDMRPSSPALAAAAAEGARARGADVIAIGLCSTDGTYFASGSLDEQRLAALPFVRRADFVLDIHSMQTGPEALTLHISSPHAETSKGVLQRNPETGGMRLAFSFDPKDRDLVELRAQLRKDGAPASEVWLYRWTP